MENWMQNLSPGQIALLLVGLLLVGSGFINTVGNAMEKIGKLIKLAKSPNARQDKDLQELGDRVTAAEKKLASDHKSIKAFEDDIRVIMASILALLGHGLDGNNMEQMQRAKEQLQEHLINRNR